MQTSVNAIKWLFCRLAIPSQYLVDRVSREFSIATISRAQEASRKILPRFVEKVRQPCYVFGLGIATSFGLLNGNPGLIFATEMHSPAIDDSMVLLRQVTGSHCTAFADASLADSASALLEIDLHGTPISAYLIWSGRDRDNEGDNVISLNDQALTAGIEHHGESGGGSWWHTYTKDVSALVKAHALAGDLLDNGLLGDVLLTFSVAGLDIAQNLGGENHGVSLIVIYEAPECGENEIKLHVGLDSFKHSAPKPIYGPHSAVHCTTIAASHQSRQVNLNLHIGGIQNADRNATIWLMTSDEATPPATLIGQEGALAFIDPVGNDATQRQWDRFSSGIELPPNHTQACVQIESTGPNGVSGVLISFMAQVYLAEVPLLNIISGKIWLDSNGDGQLTPDEPGIPNMAVLLRDGVERTIQQAFVTGPTGDYRFMGAREGDYIVDVAEDLSTQSWIQTRDPDDILDTETLVTITPGLVDENINFGFIGVAPTGSISGMIWRDINGNDLRDETEEGIPQIVVMVMDSAQNLVAEQVTTEAGAFLFSELPLLDYTVKISTASLPVDLVQTFESDGSLNGSVAVMLVDTPIQDNVAFGFGTKGQVSGRLWLDQNGDGLESADELGLNNGLILLTDARGVGRVAATQNDGNYQFTGLSEGGYILRVVQETLPLGAISTYDPDGVLDGQTTLEIAINIVITDVNFGFNFGIHSLATNPPLIDLATAGIDLNDEQALLGYLVWVLATQEDETDESPSGGESPDDVVSPGENGGESGQPELPDTSEQPAPIEPEQGVDIGGESGGESGDETGGQDGDNENPVVMHKIHLPLIQ